MAAADTTRATAPANGSQTLGTAARRLATETKQAFKTSEFWLTVSDIAMILISALVIKGGDSGNGTDEFIARQAWLFVAIVTGAYTIGRGLAKSGVRDPYTADEDR